VRARPLEPVAVLEWSVVLPELRLAMQILAMAAQELPLLHLAVAVQSRAMGVAS